MKNNFLFIAKALFLFILGITVIQSAKVKYKVLNKFLKIGFRLENYNEIRELENQRMPNFDMQRVFIYK